MPELRGFRFVTTLVVVFKKIESKDKTKYDNFFSNSKAEIIINEIDIENVFKSIYTTIISKIKKYLEKSSRWIIDSVIDHNISISMYNPLAGSSYIKLPKKLDHPIKGLINIQNTDDNECFRRCFVRYQNLANYQAARIPKADKEFAKKLGFKNKKFPVKIRHIREKEKNNSISISVFGYKNKEKHPIYVSTKCCEEKNVDLKTALKLMTNKEL